MISQNEKPGWDQIVLDQLKSPTLEGLPSFDHNWKPLDMALWVLWVAKEAAKRMQMPASEIARTLVERLEFSITPKGVTNAFNRSKAKGLVHIQKQGDETLYSIMISGKQHLIDQWGSGPVRVFYFQPGQRYRSRALLADAILTEIQGELSIVDPYCATGTLDVLARAGVDKCRFLTRLGSVSQSQGSAFLRDLQDFKSEHSGLEFRNYPHPDIHDRYIIGSGSFVILGHSIKDLGAKESFAIILNAKTNQNIAEAMVESFNRRWKQAMPI